MNGGGRRDDVVVDRREDLVGVPRAVDGPAVCSVGCRLRRALVHDVDLVDPRVAASREADLVLRVLQVEVAADRDLLRRSVDHRRGFQVEVPRHVEGRPDVHRVLEPHVGARVEEVQRARRARRRRRRDDDRHDGRRRARDRRSRRSGRVRERAGRRDSPFVSPRAEEPEDRPACRSTSRCRCRTCVVAGGQQRRVARKRGGRGAVARLQDGDRVVHAGLGERVRLLTRVAAVRVPARPRSRR